MIDVNSMTDIYVYGGAFDPITTAHEAILTDIGTNAFYHSKTGIIILVSDNDEKSYSESYENREKMVTNIVSGLSLTPQWKSYMNTNVAIIRQPERMWATLTGLKLPKDKVTICLGFDEWVSLGKLREWHNSEELLKNYKFRVYGRGCQSADIDARRLDIPDPPRGVTYAVAGIPIPNTASRKIRRQMMFNPLYDGAGLSIRTSSFIHFKGLYHQADVMQHVEGERNLLASYSPGEWPKPSVTATLAVCSSDGHILLVRRKSPPFKDYWCLPGGFTNPHESIEAAGSRELLEETSLAVPNFAIRQIKVYTPDDPRCELWRDARKKLEEMADSDTPNADAEERKRLESTVNHWGYDVGLAVLLMDKHADIKIKAKDDAAEVMWVSLQEIFDVPLAFHHTRIVQDLINIYPECLGKSKKF